MNVVIASNSVILRNMLSDLITEAGDKVLGMSANGKAIVEMVISHDIDLLILGENLSGYSENEVITILIEKKPLPILVMGASHLDHLLELGATQRVEKPDLDKLYNQDYKEKLLHLFKDLTLVNNKIGRMRTELREKYENQKIAVKSSQKIKHVAIGSSTGGPKALRKILSSLPADFPASISIVQHFEEGHELGLVEWLDEVTPLKVRLAHDSDKLKNGEVIVAPQGKHLTVKNGVFYLTDEKKVNFQKPAIDLQFKTAAQYFKNGLVAVLLTGMGRDGAKGCVDVIENGGFTIVQDEASSVVYGMPKMATELGGASVIKGIKEIADFLIQYVGDEK